MSDTAAPRAGEAAFTARTVIVLLLAGVLAFSAFVVLSAYAPDLRGGSDGGGHALSRSAIGYAGMVRLLKAMGQPVLVSRDPDARTPSTSLLVLTPGVDVDKDALDKLMTAGRMTTGPTLIVMPKWLAAPDPRTPGWVAKIGALDPGAVAKVLDRRFIGVSIARDKAVAPVRLFGLPGGPVLTGPIDQLQTLGGDPDPLLRDAEGRAILSSSADGRVFILSDPDLLDTQGIKALATARAGVAILQFVRKGDGPIIFDVTLDGLGRSRNLLKLAFEPPFLGATICLGAAALLVALQALTRFGAPRRAGRAIALGKLALADNSAGLIRLARREPRMAGRYLDLTRAGVARALGVSQTGQADLNALLDRQAERVGTGHRLAALSARADAVRDRAGLMRLAHDLYQWKTEMTGERR